MDMDVDSREDGRQGKQLVVILVGAPGSGKSTFCENVMNAPLRPWVRICQDTIGNGKAGTKAQCINSASRALSDGKNVFIDRCNLDREQRSDFVNLRNSQVDVHAVVLDLPAQLCISRSVKRTGHEGNLQGGKAAAVVNRMLQKKELPKLNEGFSRITFCHNDADVKASVGTYIALGPLDDLPHGCFGQRNQDAKVQVGIMKFMKKVNAPSSEKANDRNKPPASSHNLGKEDLSPGKEEKEPLSSSLQQEKGAKEASAGISITDVPTLAFPSISTADFQFDLEKASDIIVEKVEEFVSKIGNARLVMVDLSHGSRILSLVKAKASKKNIDPSKFFTFVGDIVHLFSKGGLRCNVIANAANWRLKPGGGGVNAAIFKAAGPDLEDATKARAKSLFPGNTVVVPLPSTSPLYVKEGVTHVIHVLGPNMNPQRPNCLDGNYAEGCQILQKAYTSLFEGFISTLTAQEKSPAESNKSLKLPSHSLHRNANDPDHRQPKSDQKNKREDVCESGNSKKSKGSPDDTHPHVREVNQASERSSKSTAKGWGSWTQALYHIAMHPERHKDETLEVTDDVVVIKDVYPKAQRHLLVLARAENVDRLADVRSEHCGLLRIMHDVGSKWAKKFIQEDSSLVFRLGYHSVPSMRQLHLHVISQDFNSSHLKHKKHWNSFNTIFFQDSVDVIEEVRRNGKPTVKDDETVLSMELRCHRCRSAHPNIPRLKSHISNCRAPFPAALLQNGSLVSASTDGQ